jgi:hypothetical protein
VGHNKPRLSPALKAAGALVNDLGPPHDESPMTNHGLQVQRDHNPFVIGISLVIGV